MTEAKRNEKYVKTLADFKTQQTGISLDVREIIFDYFNIIYKEYEISYEKHKKDQAYIEKIEEIKNQVDREYGEKKHTVPSSLTKKKTQDLIEEKKRSIDLLLDKLAKG